LGQIPMKGDKGEQDVQPDGGGGGAGLLQQVISDNLQPMKYCNYSLLLRTSSYILVSLLIPLSLSAFFLNLSVAVSVSAHPVLGWRTPINALIGSLAVVDTLTGCVGIPITAILYSPGMEELLTYVNMSLYMSYG